MISNNLNRKTISRKPRTSQPKIQKEIVSYSIYFTKNHYLCTLLSEITKSTYIIWKRNSKEPPSPRHCLMPTVRCTLAIWQVYMFLQISMYAIFAWKKKTYCSSEVQMNMGYPSPSVPKKKELPLRMWSTAIIHWLKTLLKNSEFLSMFTPVLHQRHITNWLPSFSKRCMTKENSSKRHLNNIMMKRLTSFWPTDISQVNVPIVTQKVHTVTNAKSVVLHYHPPIWLIRKVPSVAVSPWCVKPNIGICRWTSTKAGCANGFWKTTKNGVPTCTDSARAGWTWACSRVP